MRSAYIIWLSTTLSCLAASFPDYPLKPVTEYPNIVTTSGLAVAATPLEDRRGQYKYFGMDLKARGYVPVFLVIANQSSTGSVLLGKEGLMYGPAGHSQHSLADPAKSSKSDHALGAVEFIPYYGILARQMKSKSIALKQNILKKELQSSTLSPGASVQGFVFVPAHWTHSSRDKVQLSIPLIRSGSDETVTVDLSF